MGAGVGVCGLLWPRLPLRVLGVEAPAAALLENFPIYKQETPYTCGPAAARMVLEYLGHPLPEAELKRRMHTTPLLGTSPGQELKGLNYYLAQFHTGLLAKAVKGAAATNPVVLTSLQARLPVIASFITENYFKPGTLVGHYSVLIGYNPAAEEFTLANPFGYTFTINTARFWRLADWKPSPGDLPEGVKDLKVPWVPFPRTLIVLEKQSSR